MPDGTIKRLRPDKIRIGVVGCGRVAGHHLEQIVCVPAVEVAAVCDLIEAKAADLGGRYAIPYFTNYHCMLNDVPEIDAVAIITPSGMHFEHAKDIVTRYKKHLIVEKPTFLRPDQISEIYNLAQAYGASVFPIYQNRHNRAVQRVIQALDNGELGEIRIVSVRVRWCRAQHYYDLSDWRGTYSHDGGALTNQCIHHMDLVRRLCGEVTRVNATMRTLGADIEVEDTVVSTLEFKNGAVGTVEVTTAARPYDFEASLSIVGSLGMVQIGGLAVNELQIFTPDPDACDAHSEEFPTPYGFGHRQFYADIAAQLHGDAIYPISRDDCMQTLKLLHAFYRSDETGRWADVDSDTASCRLGREDEKISALYRTAAP